MGKTFKDNKDRDKFDRVKARKEKNNRKRRNIYIKKTRIHNDTQQIE